MPSKYYVVREPEDSTASNSTRLLPVCIRGLKRFLRDAFITLAGIAPLIVFLDYAMGIQLMRDYGGWTTLGFVTCVVFYLEISARYIRTKYR